MSSSMNTPSRSSQYVYNAQLSAYAKKYMASFDGSESLVDWSSRHATRFSANVNNYFPRALIMRDLSDYVSKNKLTTSYTLQSTRSTPVATRRAVASTPVATRRAVASTPVATHEASSTQSVYADKKGRNEFNRFLFSEFNTWYSAFEAEADEDDDVDSPSADSRWIYHCAKKLGKRVGLTADSLSPVVQAWLNEHKDA